ncbi:MAG: tetratricopeptide repeat protein, partial [Flavobacteriaceae bacterium]|nr:tetratricopeptide repeat protein [Flavobacteriaceae bacterium]
STIYTNDMVDYQKALELYDANQYLTAQSLFDKVSDATKNDEIKANCAYYIANCAVRLNQKNADDLMERFVHDFPTSTKRNSAYIDVADYYFENGKYSYALKWYEKVGESGLSNNQKEKYYFNNGYALFKTKNGKASKKYLTKVENSEKYGSQAKYYLGYIEYQVDNYDKANDLFAQVKEEQKFQEKLAYFQADMNFKLGKFEEAIDLATQQLPLAQDREERSELNKIVGESYFQLGNYDKALPFLQEYKGKKGRWSNVDFYQLGYIYYKRGEYIAAISEFNKIIEGDNKVVQNAYYHLGECYVKTDKKQEALNAFRNAAYMNYDDVVKKDAWLQYAKISYEIGNPYQTVPQVLSTYLEKYPESEAKEEIQGLLIDSYITSKNYKEALVLLEKSNSQAHKAAYQKVAFYRAIEIFNEGDYQGAIVHFDKSLKEPKDQDFVARSVFWKAESQYLLTDYENALTGFKVFADDPASDGKKEKENIDYNLAYTSFKLKQYPAAINYFKSYIANVKDDQVRLNDAHLRLGDSYFVTSDYWKAMESYNDAIKMNGVDADYAHFQKAISYGYVKKNKEKIEDLKLFLKNYPTSPFQDDALFELGNSYVKENDNAKALETYDKLNYNHPKSSYVSRSLLRQGSIYYNDAKNEQALNKFKRIASDYPSTAEANQAVAQARELYVDLGRVEEYSAWVKGLEFVDVDDADLDNATYESAEKQYLDNKTSGAIKGFENYTREFPNGLHALQANFYLAQLYFKEDRKLETIRYYEFVINKERNEFTEQALARLSQVHLEAKDWQKAIDVLLRLEVEADFPQNVIYAQSNLMKGFYQLDKYDQAVDYAGKVLGNDKIDNKIKSDAQVIIARSAIKLDDLDKAKEAYAEVQKIAKGSLAAEALYYDAFFKNREEQFEKSNEKIQKLVKDYSGYKLYGAKGLVLMAKNFHELDDAYQATYILESVIENFTDYPEVVEEAKQELQRIKTEESKRNSSIDTDAIED